MSYALSHFSHEKMGTPEVKLHQDHTNERAIIQTPSYLSPEDLPSHPILNQGSLLPANVYSGLRPQELLRYSVVGLHHLPASRSEHWEGGTWFQYGLPAAAAVGPPSKYLESFKPSFHPFINELMRIKIPLPHGNLRM